MVYGDCATCRRNVTENIICSLPIVLGRITACDHGGGGVRPSCHTRARSAYRPAFSYRCITGTSCCRLWREGQLDWTSDGRIRKQTDGSGQQHNKMQLAHFRPDPVRDTRYVFISGRWPIYIVDVGLSHTNNAPHQSRNTRVHTGMHPVYINDTNTSPATPAYWHICARQPRHVAPAWDVFRWKRVCSECASWATETRAAHDCCDTCLEKHSTCRS